MGFIKSISSMAKSIIPAKFRNKQTSFTKKFGQEIQSLISPAKERTDVHQRTSVLPPRRPLPPGVYEEIIQKRRFKFVAGFWKKPEITAVDLARIKKKFILAGYDWPVKPYVDLVRHYEKARSTYYHPDKLKRMQKIEACMKKMPDILKEYKLKVTREKAEEEARSFKTEQEVYVDALNAGKREAPEWVQENIRQSKLRKAQSKQLVITTKKKKK